MTASLPTTGAVADTSSIFPAWTDPDVNPLDDPALLALPHPVRVDAALGEPNETGLFTALGLWEAVQPYLGDEHLRLHPDRPDPVPAARRRDRHREPYGSLRPHWRRGHFRRIRFGEQLSESRLGWIRPVLVKANEAFASVKAKPYRLR